jgi:hypothetical protein
MLTRRLFPLLLAFSFIFAGSILIIPQDASARGRVVQIVHGARGAKGAKGNTGAKGDTGAVGPAGATGP